jgi:ABC-type antimicrobial peptide transport system permease subunit
VIGVVKDFTSGNLFEPLQPYAIRTVDPSKYAQLIVRTKPGEINNVYNQAKKVWASIFPLKPFSGYYQGEAGGAAESIRTNNSIATIFFWFAIISVLLTATGLFALISLTVLKKMREIAIRKVVGASPNHIYQLVLKGYVLIFLLASVLGCYAGFALARLLMDMIFRINAGVSLPVLWIALACVLMITTVTVVSRVWVALRTKPTDVLKGA